MDVAGWIESYIRWIRLSVEQGVRFVVEIYFDTCFHVLADAVHVVRGKERCDLFAKREKKTGFSSRNAVVESECTFVRKRPNYSIDSLSR